MIGQTLARYHHQTDTRCNTHEMHDCGLTQPSSVQPTHTVKPWPLRPDLNTPQCSSMDGDCTNGHPSYPLYQTFDLLVSRTRPLIQLMHLIASLILGHSVTTLCPGLVTEQIDSKRL